MDFTLTYEQVCQQVQADDLGKEDVLIPRQEIALHEGRITFQEGVNRDTPHTLLPTSWALTQMCQRLGIPAAYFKRCSLHLQDAQFHHWLGQEEIVQQTNRRTRTEPEQWLLRCRHETLRGVLSDRYARMDNASLLQCLEPLRESHWQVGWFALTEESLHLRLVDPRLARDVLPNDRLMVGLHIANSEVGKRAVTVDAIVFRVICRNGLIRLVKGKSLLHQRHLYLSQPLFEGALREAVGEAITIAAGFLEQLSWATRTPVPDVEATLKSLSARWNLSREFSEQVRVSLLNERPSQQETVYGLVNALTHSAQRLPVDERYHLEALAGSLLEQGLPRTDRRVSFPPVPFEIDQEPPREVLELAA